MSVDGIKSTIPIGNGGQIGVIVASSLSIFIPSLLVVLRFVSKRKIGRSIDGSDYCILAALLFNIGLHIDCWLMVFLGGFGFHVTDVALRFGADTLTFFFKCIMCFALLWNVTICFSKLSVLLMYSAIIPVQRLIIPARVLGVFIILWNVSSFIAGLALCQPIAKNWDTSITEGFCGDQVKYYMWLGIINVITDVVILGLPLPFLYNLNLKTRKKILLLGMFSIGFCTCVITIYRQTMLPQLDFTDMTWSGLLATIFSGLEPAVAISLACVPFLRPIFDTKQDGQTPSNYYVPEGSDQFSKGNRSDSGRPFQELDDASDIQLQPVKAESDFRISINTSSEGKDATNQSAQPNGITVYTKWEVKADNKV